jgi:mono/diheme cytochrome c family protein
MRFPRILILTICLLSAIPLFSDGALGQETGGYYPRPSSAAIRQFPLKPFQLGQNPNSATTPQTAPREQNFAVKPAAVQQTTDAPPDNLPSPTNAPEALAPHVGMPALEADQIVASQSDRSLVLRGEEAFGKACIACHDAERSLCKSRSLAAWQSTVRRMADKDGADIPCQDIDAIAAYLAARACDNPNEGAAQPGVTVYGTVSPLWRGGNDNLQNPGFFPDAWVGVSFQSNSPVSGRVTSCISCHTEPGLGSRIELVEAVLRLDLAKLAGCRNPAIKSSIEAGRIIVPFGAFASQSNPGVYRTVSKPLIYNMGQRVRDGDLGDPVLPMPYSDEGAVFNFGAPIVGDIVTSWDLYAVNGLQGASDGIDFDRSRDYVDNNTSPSTGTRLTVGNQFLRLGSSFMAGEFTPTGGADQTGQKLNYWVYGYDAVLRYQDLLRVQFEYARRDNERIIGPDTTRDHVDGYYVETELMLSRARRVSLIARYDRQSRVSQAPPPDSVLATGTFAVTRFTYGLNVILPGGSLLMINHERWFLPDGMERTDVLGVRWACTF